MNSNNKIQNPYILESVHVPNFLLTSTLSQIHMYLNIHKTKLKTNKQTNFIA